MIRLSDAGQAMMNKAFGQIGERFLDRIKDSSTEELEEINRALDVLQSKVFNSGQ
ncbi:hypothetical protein D3C78_1848230 [compost metagenome]